MNGFDAQGIFVGSAADCFTRGWIVYRNHEKHVCTSQADAERKLREFGAVQFSEVDSI